MRSSRRSNRASGAERRRRTELVWWEHKRRPAVLLRHLATRAFAPAAERRSSWIIKAIKRRAKRARETFGRRQAPGKMICLASHSGTSIAHITLMVKETPPPVVPAARPAVYVAAERVSTVRGVRALVNRLNVAASTVNDDELGARVRGSLSVDGSRLELEVRGGVASISGTVPNRAVHDAVLENIRQARPLAIEDHLERAER